VIYLVQFYIRFALCILFTYCYHHFSLSNDATYLWQMMHTCTGEFVVDVPEPSTGRAGASHPAPCGTAPTSPTPPLPPMLPIIIEQLLATQNELMLALVENMGHQLYHQQVLDSSYMDFLVTHPPTFAEASDPLEVDK
jgi:hypothetical protein